MAGRTTTSRRAALALVAALAAGCGAGPGEAARPRNLVLISLDTLRADHLGCYGHAHETSPAIDALAARGVRFADASASAPWTLPSHTTMFTGLYPSHHGVKDYSQRLPEAATTLAELLRAQGFQTWAVINTWNLADPRFEVFQGFERKDVHYVSEFRQVEGGGQVIENTGAEVARQARAALASRDRARPFFLFAHFYDAHSDFDPAPEYRARFVGPYAGDVDGTTAQLLAVRGAGVVLGPADLRHLHELYDAEIRQLDDVLAGLLSDLRREGLEEDTLVVLVSDHGEEFQEHGGLLHGRTQYQELLHVPLILAGPGVPAGQVVSEPVGLVDLMPTILGRFGLAPPRALDGLDLALTWSGAGLPERALFGEADHNNSVNGKPVIDIKRMARVGSEKLHLDRSSGQVQLYDLARDPGEAHDLAADSPERTRVLRAALTRFLDGEVSGQGSGVELSPEEQELLKKLGYAGDEER